MKRYYVPREKRSKAWQWCLNNLGERDGIRVRFVNGMTGDLVKDRVYKRRMPVYARAFCLRGSIAGLIWEATW